VEFRSYVVNKGGGTARETRGEKGKTERGGTVNETLRTGNYGRKTDVVMSRGKPRGTGHLEKRSCRDGRGGKKTGWKLYDIRIEVRTTSSGREYNAKK